MGRAKLPRKSTNIDMTAMCDVAFLLLSFFILATKTKPPEVVDISNPSSISNKSVDKENQVIIDLAKDGKIFLEISDADKRQKVVEDLNKRLSLQLSSSDLASVKTANFFGTDLSQVQSFLRLPADKRSSATLPGITATDTAHNQLKDWMESVAIVYFGQKISLLVKGDQVAKYPVFKNVIDAFKKNDLMKFDIITNQENVGKETEYFKVHEADKKPA